MTQSRWRLLRGVRGWPAAVGAPVGPGPAGPTRLLRVRWSAGGVAGHVAADPETAAALRSYGLGWAGKGGGAVKDVRLCVRANDVCC